MLGVSLCRFAVILSVFGVAVSSPTPAPTGTPDSPPSVLSSVGVDPSLAAQSSQLVGRPDFTCKVLSVLFPKNETFASTSPVYNPLVQEARSETCWLTPACIVTPDTAQDVSKIMKILQVLQTKFAIRSGGDASVPGFNSIGNNGVLIALQNLNKLSMSQDKKTLTTGPGNRWGAVYGLAEQNGKAVVGGREPVVGVGGCLLGGCLTAFYNTVGLGIDNVSRFEVVLTDGSIKQATASQNADLFKALKGGLTNLGVVTEFDMITNDYNKAYYEVYLYKPADTPAVLKAYANYLSNPNVDPKSQAAVQVNPTYTFAFLGYIGTANRPAMFNEFYKIPVLSTVAPPTNGTINQLIFLGSAPAPGNSYVSSFTHKVVSPDFYLDSFQTYLAINKTLPAGIAYTYQPQGVTPNLVDVGLAVNPSGNLLGIEKTPQAWINIYASWNDDSLTDKAQGAVDDFERQMTKKAKDQGIFLPFIDVNNGNVNLKPLRGYGDQNFNTIAAAAKKYDPRGVMQKLQNDGFLYTKE